LLIFGLVVNISSGFAEISADPIEKLVQECNDGKYTSCSDLGKMFFYGREVKKDYAKAFELFTIACNGGETTGCSNLGVMYEHGYGVTQDYEKAAT